MSEITMKPALKQDRRGQNCDFEEVVASNLLCQPRMMATEPSLLELSITTLKWSLTATSVALWLVIKSTLSS